MVNIVGMIKKKEPILHTRASYNDYPDTPNFPKLKFQNMESSNVVRMGYCHLYADPVPLQDVDSALELDWDNQPSRDYNMETFSKFKKENDLEFKNIFSLMHLMHQKQKDFGRRYTDSKLVEAVLAEYLHNLVFTRWLYQDFAEYKKYVKEQKRKKRLNYQTNVRERENYDNPCGNETS